ncbi:MAG TPA: DUF4386 domain-containing protein [Spirochaetia bacterium]|nr:DUF4386 domain-containing protein [Spirochaetia bacterium]
MSFPKRNARIAGALYLVIAAAAIVAHMYVPSVLIVPDDPATTAANIAASGTLFRLGIAGEFVVLLSEVVLSVLLYVLLKPVNKTVSLLAMASRLVMTTIHGLNLLNSYIVLMLVSGTGPSLAFEAAQTNALVSIFLEAHSYGFTIGILFLTIHVFALGYLILRSGYFPRILGYLFFAAAVGYLIDSTAMLLFPGYETTPVYLMLPITISELAFPLWLVIRGLNLERWNERLQPAAA